MQNLAVEKYNKQEISRSFTRAASTYDKVATLQSSIGKYLLNKITDLQIRPEMIVDIGCGTGEHTRLMARKFPQACVIGIDIASGMLEYAKRKVDHPIQWICSDADRLPIQQAQCDLIFSNFMLQWSSNENNTLQEISRILKQNGLFICSTFGSKTLEELRYAWRALDAYPHVHDFIHHNQLFCALSSANFSGIKLEVKYYKKYYSTALELMQELKALGALNLRIDRNRGLLTSHQLKQVIKAYDQFRNNQGLLPATYEIYIILAIKSSR